MERTVETHGEGECFESFILNFETIISKYEWPPHEKYVYLELQLKDRALLLVRYLYGKDQSTRKHFS